MTVGVLAFQGDFQRHYELLLSMGIHVRYVRRRDEIEAVDALVIPGGESTTIGKLLERFDLMQLLRDRISDGMPVFGTCAGAILLAKQIEGSDQERIGTMDISVSRNAYGSQIESFEADVSVEILAGEPIRGVFIRAPVIRSTGDGVDVMGTFEGHPVVARQGNMLVATFHPELAGDTRLHAYFASTAGRVVAG